MKKLALNMDIPSELIENDELDNSLDYIPAQKPKTLLERYFDNVSNMPEFFKGLTEDELVQFLREFCQELNKSYDGNFSSELPESAWNLAWGQLEKMKSDKINSLVDECIEILQ